MRARFAALYRYPAFVAALALLAHLFAGMTQAGPSGLAAPLVMSALLVVAVVVASLAGVELRLVLGRRRGRHDEAVARVPIRQCDPDAAGRARPRAPGSAVLCAA